MHVGITGNDVTLIHDTQLLQVHPAHLPLQIEIHVVGLQLTRHVKLPAQHAVRTVHLGIQQAVAQADVAPDATEVVASIAELAHLQVDVGSRRWIEEVRAMSLRRELTGERSQSLTGQEVLQMQVLRCCLHIVGHSARIKRPLCLHASASFGHREITGILLTVDSEIAIEADATRQRHLLPHVGRHHGRHHAQIVGASLDVDVGPQAVSIGGIGHPSRCLHVRHTRQVSPEVLEGEVLQIALGMSLDRQRTLGPVRHHLLRQVGHKHLHVMLTYLSVHIGIELSRIVVVKSIQFHLVIGRKIRRGGLHLTV